MNFLEKEFHKRKKRKLKKTNTFLLWKFSLLSYNSNSIVEKQYVDLDTNSKVLTTFLNIYSETIKESTIESLIKMMFTKRNTLQSIKKTLDHNDIPFDNFLMFCFLQLSTRKRKFIDTVKYIYYQSLKDLDAAIGDPMFSWHSIQLEIKKIKNGIDFLKALNIKPIKEGLCHRQENQYVNLKDLVA